MFANGKLVHPEGPHGDAPQHYQQISRIYDLNLSPDETSLTLVIRTIYIPFGLQRLYQLLCQSNALPWESRRSESRAGNLAGQRTV